jgi:hypothetical protein
MSGSAVALESVCIHFSSKFLASGFWKAVEGTFLRDGISFKPLVENTVLPRTRALCIIEPLFPYKTQQTIVQEKAVRTCPPLRSLRSLPLAYHELPHICTSMTCMQDLANGSLSPERPTVESIVVPVFTQEDVCRSLHGPQLIPEMVMSECVSVASAYPRSRVVMALTGVRYCIDQDLGERVAS